MARWPRAFQKELPLDILEFFCLTPLPGSENHQVLWKNGIAMEEDLNKYDVEHVCAPHPKMNKHEWEAIYREAWSLYYTPEHMKTLLRRMAATGGSMGSLVKVLVAFSTTVRLEQVHPLQAGVFRLRHPSERRPGLPRESPWIFWPRLIWQTLSKHVRLAGTIGRLLLMKTAIERDPNARAYLDQALEPVHNDEDETLGLLTQTTGALAAIAHVKKIAELTGAGRVYRLNEYAEPG